MSPILVDTSVWFAYVNARDERHSAAQRLLSGPGLVRVTPWPVVWETVTLLVARTTPAAGAEIGRQFLRRHLGNVVMPSDADHIMALALIERFAYLRLSAADALSCAMARRLGIGRVASFDSHFRAVLPDCEVVGTS